MADHKRTGAEVVIKALVDQGVDVIFGYPGGSVLPLYDEIFKQNQIRHILVRHEQGAVHAAEGYARSTGKVGVVLVTSGPGATNTVTGLANANMDSVPIVCLTGQVATNLIGNDAFQEADITGITRPCTKHNYLVKRPEDLARVLHEAFQVATTGRPGPVLVDLPKDITMAEAPYVGPSRVRHKSYHPPVKGDLRSIEKAVDLIASARQPVFYCGGGVINSGTHASQLLTQFVRATGYPITTTLMGLGCYPASDPQFLGMCGMHGTYEANMAMHDCDVMIGIGVRFDDRVTSRLDAFSPNSAKIQIDIDPSSINKNIAVDVAILGDVGYVLEDMIKVWKARVARPDATAIASWWKKIEKWRAKNSLAFENSDTIIKPQYALQRLGALTRETGREVYFTTEVGQHQMFAAQHLCFDEPKHFMTSGGLGTMGFGLPASVGVQVARPDALVVAIAGEASFQMNMQELGTIIQHRLPIKIFIMNNQYMGMVRQWQELLHGGRYSESHMDVNPDLVKLAEAYGMTGLRVDKPADLDDTIRTMLATDGPVIVDVRVDPSENVFPMVPAGSPHNHMLMGENDTEIMLIDKDAGAILV